MNKAIQKTAAEEGFASLYKDLSDSLPGSDKIAQMRQEAMALFAKKGLPHRRVEEWRYTDLKTRLKTAYRPQPSGHVSATEINEALGALGGIEAFRLVFVDGVFVADVSQMPEAQSGLEVKSMTQAWADSGFVDHFTAASRMEGADDDAVMALNTALMADGIVLNVSGNVQKPVHLVHVNSGKTEHLVTLRHHIEVAENARVTLLESHVAVGDEAMQCNLLTHIAIGKGARVDHVKFQNENRATTHLSTLKADLGEEAVYHEHQFNMGGGLVRNQHFIRFSGENADYDMSGASLLNGRQHCDTTLLVNHAARSCKSRETLKAVLDEKARAVFQAKVIVQQIAQKTDGKQMMRGLMLSDGAEFDVKPELEIYADDVECGHGATSGKIDEDLLFYLRSRGIGEKEARGLLIQAFVGDVIEHIHHEGIREAMSEYARTWLVSQTR